ncbi:MAG: GNAT family N-acetyltransferase [Gemmatimonadetes bacterium]|nr:MAG: GNAT family N-acetyltransferase [Gemmatimonadota bacterium]
MIRPARPDDLDALEELENTCFAADRLSRRAFRRFLASRSALLLVDDAGAEGGLLAYGLVLFRRTTSIARLYSIAVQPAARGQGIARALLERLEAEALVRGAVAVRLEVREDNEAAAALYRRLGYQAFARVSGYYEDGAAAVRMEKELAPHLTAAQARVPYYPQTLDFTCGSACLMMAMKALRPSVDFSRNLELRLWREATTIFMNAGHGGCGPYGLATAALRRGFAVDLFVADRPGLFVDSVRSVAKRRVVELVEADQKAEALALGARIRHQSPSVRRLRRAFEAGDVPVVLVSAYRLTGEKAPHWVVVTGFDDRFVYIHDPYIEVEEGETEAVCIGIPVGLSEFERMARYGKGRAYAALLVRATDSGASR